jgi:hypothetical protein
MKIGKLSAPIGDHHEKAGPTSLDLFSITENGKTSA